MISLNTAKYLVGKLRVVKPQISKPNSITNNSNGLRTQRGRGIMLFIREDIPSELLNVDTCISGNENLLVEINLRSKKWLVSGSYNPHLNSI